MRNSSQATSDCQLGAKSNSTCAVEETPSSSGGEEGDKVELPICGAKMRWGGICNSPVVSGKRRCRIHGGAEGSGAPKGNQNATKTGCYSKKARLARKFGRRGRGKRRKKKNYETPRGRPRKKRSLDTILKMHMPPRPKG